MRRTLMAIFIGLALVSTIVPASSEEVQYGHAWGTSGEDEARAVQSDAAGNVYLAGTSILTDGSLKSFVVKTDSLGNIVWDAFIEAPGRTLFLTDMVLTAAGDIYVCGGSDVEYGGDVFYAKLTNDGSLVYCRIVQGELQATRIADDPYSGGFVLADYFWGGVIAVDSSGAVRWNRYVDNMYTFPWAVCTDNAGNVIAVCDRDTTNFGIVKFDASGNLIRQRFLATPDPPYEYSWDVIQGSDGYIYALGAAYSEGQLLLMKMTTDLDVLWCEYVGNPNFNQETTEIMEASDGSLYSIGSAYSENSSGPAMYHFDRDGNLLEATYYSGPNGANVRFTDATPMANGGIVVAGASFGTPEVNAYPIPGVVVTQIIDSWQEDTTGWAALDMSVVGAGATLSDPGATMDDYSTSMLYQAWFGMIDTNQASLLVDATYRQHGANGQRASFKATATNGTSPYTYNWDFGDGFAATGQRVTHTYSTGGLYNARVMVMDSMGKFGFDSVQVIVAGPPVITGLAIWPLPAMVNQDVMMQVYATDYAGSIAGFYWEFGDGSSVSTVDGYVTHIYSQEGWFNVTVTVTDDSGDTATITSYLEVVSVINEIPVPGFSSWPSGPTVGQTVYFDGTYSYDPDGWITQYQWDFGNGQYSSSPIASTVYAQAGTYSPTLQVWDNLGASAAIVGYLVVSEMPPVPQDQYEPDDVWLNATSISVGSMQTHTISGGGSDTDWVKFTLAESAGVSIETSGAAWGDTVIYLYNVSGVPMWPFAWDDNSGQSNWSKITGNLTAGQYWVRIIEAGQDNEIASYSIQIRVVGAGAAWTLMVYMDADNNLEYAAFLDFLEMSSVGSNAQMNIVVQFDRIGFETNYSGWTTTKRFYITQGMTPEPGNALMDMGELNMGSGEVLSDFIIWSMSNYPADNYMLDMWDHGGGWDGAVCWDDTSGDAVTLWELANALNVSSATVGDRIDSVAFDACLMAMAEVTYSVRDLTDVLVYSEEVMWDIGLPYDMILQDLAADPTVGAAAFATSIVDNYMEYFGWGGIETISAVDVASTGALFAAIDNLGMQLNNSLDVHEWEIQMARNATISYYYSDYIDLYDLCDQLSIYVSNSSLLPALSEVRGAVSNAVFAEGHGIAQEGSHGLSIYFPMWGYSTSYDTLAFSDLSWNDFLRAYNGIVPAEPDSYEPDNFYTDARPISFGESQNHSIDQLGQDVDWVTFTMTNESYVTIRTSAPWGVMADTVLYLYDSFGVPDNWIAISDDAWGNLWSMIVISLPPGTYYAMVESYDHSSEIPVYFLELIEGSANEPPVITMLYCSSPVTTPYTQVYFYVEAYDPDGWIDHFEWDLGDGNIIWTYGNYLYYSWPVGGMYSVAVTACDNFGGRTTATTMVEVLMPPVAVITMTPTTGKVGAPITFSGEGSYSPGGGIIMGYEWWFSNGGNYSSGPVVTRVFLEAGAYEVFLTVWDDHGLYSQARLSFAVVEPMPPVAIVSFSPARPMVGQTVTFDGSYSIDPDGSIPTFIWEFGDGAVGVGMVVTHEYAYADDYVVKLTVIDEDKLTDDDTTSITVVSAPVAAFEYSPALPGVGQQVTFYAYGSFDQLGIVDYVWAFGDGTYAQGWQVQHSFSAAGDYQVTLTVTSAAGVVADVSRTVTVSQVLMQQVAPEQAPPEDGGAVPFLVLSEIQVTGLICLALAGLVKGAALYRRKIVKEIVSLREAVA